MKKRINFPIPIIIFLILICIFMISLAVELFSSLKESLFQKIFLSLTFIPFILAIILIITRKKWGRIYCFVLHCLLILLLTSVIVGGFLKKGFHIAWFIILHPMLGLIVLAFFIGFSKKSIEYFNK